MLHMDSLNEDNVEALVDALAAQTRKYVAEEAAKTRRYVDSRFDALHMVAANLRNARPRLRLVVNER